VSIWARGACRKLAQRRNPKPKPAGRAPPGALLFVSRQKVGKKRLPLRGALLEGRWSSGNVDGECRPQVSATVASCDRFSGRRQKYSSYEGGSICCWLRAFKTPIKRQALGFMVFYQQPTCCTVARGIKSNSAPYVRPEEEVPQRRAGVPKTSESSPCHQSYATVVWRQPTLGYGS
jgi:hypothetical protein